MVTHLLGQSSTYDEIKGHKSMITIMYNAKQVHLAVRLRHERIHQGNKNAFLRVTVEYKKCPKEGSVRYKLLKCCQVLAFSALLHYDKPSWSYIIDTYFHVLSFRFR